jgi:oligopeptide/dipeptide ABC transporter ATP-binding protein
MLKHLKSELGMALVFITHDLLAVKGADRIAVMYAGRVVESGAADDVFARPAHPYTEALLLSTPRLAGSSRLQPIAGRPPGLDRLPAGCAFAPRCNYQRPLCVSQRPPSLTLGNDRTSACHFAPDFREASVA